MEQCQAGQPNERRQVVRDEPIVQGGCERYDHVGSDELNLSTQSGLGAAGVDTRSLQIAEMAHRQICDRRLLGSQEPDEVGEETVIRP